jgi:hypothetical protein
MDVVIGSKVKTVLCVVVKTSVPEDHCSVRVVVRGLHEKVVSLGKVYGGSMMLQGG